MNQVWKTILGFIVLSAAVLLILYGCHLLQDRQISAGAAQYTRFTFPVSYSLKVLPWLLSGCVFGLLLRGKLTVSRAFAGTFFLLAVLLYVFFLCNVMFWQPVLLPEILPELIMVMAFGASFILCAGLRRR